MELTKKTPYANVLYNKRGRGVLIVLLAYLFLLVACDEPDVSAQDTREPMALVSEPDAGPAYEGPAPLYSKVPVFTKDLLLPGYLHFRIPALAITPQGTLLAFTEMRTGADLVPKTLACRRSVDNGETWGPVTLLEEHTLTKVYGNETVVVDWETGKIHLFYLQVFSNSSGNTGNMYHKVSSDDGVTWSERVLMADVVNAGWRPAGPGTGIQLERGEHAGRLIVPGRYSDGGKGGNYLMYSDDGGETWNVGFKSNSSPGILENETTCVELVGDDGGESVIYINARNQASPTEDVYRRLDAYAGNCGETVLSGFERNTYIRTDRVHASLLRWSAMDKGQARNRILFSCVSWAPAFQGGGAQGRRRHVGIWSSFDETESWTPVAKRVHDVKGGYSSMGKTADGLIAILFEEGTDSYYSETSLVKINEAFLDVPLAGVKWDFEENAPGESIGDGERLTDKYANGTGRAIQAVGGSMPLVAGSEVFKQNTALDFGGSSYLRLSDNDTWTQLDFHEYASFTVEAVVRTSQSREQFLVGRQHLPGWPQWFLQVDKEGVASFRVDDDESFSVVKTGTKVNDGKWHHIAAVRDRDSQKLKIYVDGQLSGEADDAVKGSLANRKTLFIGGTDAGDRNFIGQIDFVRIAPAAMETFFE